MDTLSNPFWDSQGRIASPHFGRLVSNLDHSGLLDEETPDRAFAEKPKL
jgi:hypothetical protein